MQGDDSRHLHAQLPVEGIGALFRLAAAGGVVADLVLVEGSDAHFWAVISREEQRFGFCSRDERKRVWFCVAFSEWGMDLVERR